MSDWFDDEDVNARVTTTFTCEHNRNGCPLCAEKVFEQAGELTTLRKQVQIFRKQAEHYADQGNWVQSEAWVNTRNLYNFEVNGYNIAAQALAEADRVEE